MSKKLLVLNPSEDATKDYYMIDFNHVLKEVAAKIFGSTEDKFRPFLFTEKHVRLFIANVEQRMVASTKYSGKQINTFAEGIAYLNEIGAQIYESDWKIKLLKTTVLVSRPLEFGLMVPTEQALKNIKAEFNDPELVTLVIHRPLNQNNQAQAETQEESEN